RRNPGAPGKIARGRNRTWREIEPGRFRATAGERYRIEPEMALQMQQTPAVNVSQFGSHDRIQRFGAGEKSLDLVETGPVPQMDRDTILPIAAIGFEEAVRGHCLECWSLHRRTRY